MLWQNTVTITTIMTTSVTNCSFNVQFHPSYSTLRMISLFEVVGAWLTDTMPFPVSNH